MVEPLEIAVQETPNPNAAKFTLNRVVTDRGLTFRDPAAAPPAWVKDLLEVAGVTQVFALKNFISVSKAPDAEWEIIGPQVERILRQAFA